MKNRIDKSNTSGREDRLTLSEKIMIMEEKEKEKCLVADAVFKAEKARKVFDKKNNDRDANFGKGENITKSDTKNGYIDNYNEKRNVVKKYDVKERTIDKTKEKKRKYVNKQ